jgi:hypothetical protein
LAGFDVADGGVERVDDVEQADVPGGVGQADLPGGPVAGVHIVAGEGGGGVAGLKLFTDNGELFPQFKGFAGALFHASVSPLRVARGAWRVVCW